MKEKKETLTLVRTWATELLEEFFFKKQQILQGPSNRQEHRASWIPPVGNELKVNFEDTIFQDSKEVDIGMIVRDHEGKPITALAQKRPLPHTVKEVEALAGRKATRLVKKIQLDKVLFEGDSKTHTTALNIEEMCLAPYREYQRDG